jgi:tetratricopeptide (TPR) repeat protein
MGTDYQSVLCRLVDAERLCRTGLQLSEKLLAATVARYRKGGKENPGADVTLGDVMYAYNGLASVLQAQGQFKEALPYFEKVLRTCRKVRPV